MAKFICAHLREILCTTVQMKKQFFFAEENLTDPYG